MNDLISIVVPIYNSSPFLKECLSSIDKQTYKHYEVILIDDGSTDDSFKICCDYCKSHKNFKVVHKDNDYGVSYTRNLGINHAKGKYICFIDSDDFINENYLKKLYESFGTNDIVFTRFDKFLSNKQFLPYFETRLEDLIKSPSAIELFFTGNFYSVNNKCIKTDKVFGSSCRSLFNLSIIKEKNIQFPIDVKLGEDTIFMMQYLLHCKKCGFVDEYLYHYRDNNESAVKKYASNYINEFYKNRIPTLKNEIQLLSKIDNKFYNDFLTNYLKMDFNMNFVINEIKINNYKTVDKLKEISRADYKKYLSFKISKISKIDKIDFKRRCFLFLLKRRHYKLIHILLRGKR